MRPSGPVLEAVGISKSFLRGENALPILDGFDFSADRGETVAIVGRSGSGKSTLLSILGLMLEPDAGVITVAGTTATGANRRRLTAIRRAHLGFVFQQFHLVGYLDAAANVELALAYSDLTQHERAQRVEEVLERVGLAHRSRHRPSELSGGECQRVAIARTLVKRPSIVLADEPTGALDRTTSEQFLELLDRLRGDTAVVVVTHDPDVAGWADRLVDLDAECQR